MSQCDDILVCIYNVEWLNQTANSSPHILSFHHENIKVSCSNFQTRGTLLFIVATVQGGGWKLTPCLTEPS